MTIPASLRRAGPFDGNDVATEFPFTFKVFDKTEVQATLTDPAGVESTLLLDSDYSVTISADPQAPGGTVVYPITGAPLPAGYRLTLSGRLPYSQTADIQNQGGFYPDIIEGALDRLAVQTQQLAERADRTVQVPVSSDTTPEQLIDQLVQASADAQTAAQAAQASQTASAASETNAGNYAASALASKNAAALSEANAGDAASAALAHKNAAALSEANAGDAAGDAGAAAGVATGARDTAVAAAGAASTSEANAATSETNAGNYAASALASADRAEAAVTAGGWMSVPIGMPFPLVPGAPLPPTDAPSFRYVILTAGLDGAGQYNEGVLTDETVTGSDPTITATAVVSLTGSPMDGQTIDLINTSRAFLRPGAPGPIVDSQNLEHTHTLVAMTQSVVGGGEGTVYRGNNRTVTTAPSGGDEARPRYIPRPYLMRIL